MTITPDYDESTDDLDVFDTDMSALSGSDQQPTLTVREINDAISAAVSGSFPSDIWVRGEVQRLNFHTSGHVYFQLADSDSKGSGSCVIPVTLLKWNAGKIKGNLREILAEDREVRMLVRPDFYAPYGKMSLQASDIDTAFSLGQIALARRELIGRLTVEGVLRANAQCELDEMCRDIVLITSIDSAAYHDVIDQLRNSGFGFSIRAINALMQGKDSPTSVTNALGFADSLEADVVLLCRGGGAKSDLATFDSEIVARSIISMNTPVITGLGHQIDVSVADIVSHSSLKTPTACAQFMIERTTAAVDECIALGTSIEDIVIERLVTGETRLANISQKIGDVNHVLERSSFALKTFSDRIHAGSLRVFENANEKLTSVSKLIAAHDPMRVLERGYSVTTDSNGAIVRTISDAPTGAQLTTRLVDGELVSTVTDSK